RAPCRARRGRHRLCLRGSPRASDAGRAAPGTSRRRPAPATARAPATRAAAPWSISTRRHRARRRTTAAWGDTPRGPGGRSLVLLRQLEPEPAVRRERHEVRQFADARERHAPQQLVGHVVLVLAELQLARLREARQVVDAEDHVTFELA